MDEYTKKDFIKIIKHTALDVRRWMRLSDSTCGRIYDRNLEDLNLSIELFDTYVKVVDYSEEGLDDDMITQVIDQISRNAYIEKSKIIYQLRKKREGLEQHKLITDETIPLTVKENGLIFNVELSSHIDTGLFLDLALVRAFVKDNAFGKTVLNLFSYTGSFSVYAASGLAKKVVSVDLSNTATMRARENLKNNGFLSEIEYPCISSDALSFIKKAQDDNSKFDIIIFDPPSFSNSNKMNGIFDVQKQYLNYIYEISLLMNKGSVLIFSTNLSNFQFDKKLLKASFKIQELTDEFRQVGFGKKKATSRVWSLEKVAEMNKVPQRRISARKDAQTMEKENETNLDRLSVSWDEEETKEQVSTPEGVAEMEQVESIESTENEAFVNDDEPMNEDVKESSEQSQEDRPRRDYAGRPRRDSSDRPRRDSSDRPRRDFSDRPRRDNDDRPRRDFSDRPRGNFEDRPRRDFSDRPRGNFEDRPRRDFSDRPRGNFEDRPRRDFSDRPRGNFEDRPRRDFSDRPRGNFEDRPRRDFSDRPRGNFEDRPRRDFSDRPRGNFEDRPRRDFSDRPRGNFEDRPRRDFSDRPRGNFEDRPRRDFSDRPRGNFEDRPRRDFSDRPRGNFEDRPRRDFSDRPRGNFEDRPRRDFSDRPRGNFEDRPRRDFSDRPRRDFEDRPRFDRTSEPRVKKSAPKPYGFDQFMETKSRKKDTEFVYSKDDDSSDK